MKIKWARCKEDVAEFEAQIAGHAASIQLLLSAVEMQARITYKDAYS